jgi:hypothetical protein
MIDDEFNDPELARRLGRLAGSTPDVGPAYVGVQQRVAKVRRRRVAMISAAGVSVVVLGVFALRPQSGDNEVFVADESESSSVDNSPPRNPLESSTSLSGQADSSVGPPPSSSGEISTIASDTTAPGGGTTAVPQPQSSADSAGPGVTGPPAPVAPTPTTAALPPATTKPPTTRPPTTIRPPSTTTPPPATTAAPAPGTTPAPSGEIVRGQATVGGSITVRLSGGVLTLQSSTANPGFEKNVKSSGPTRVEVEFESDTQKFRIRARIVGGDISIEVDEESSDGGGGGDGGGDDGGGDGGGEEPESSLAPLGPVPTVGTIAPIGTVLPVPEISTGGEPEDVIIEIEFGNGP